MNKLYNFADYENEKFIDLSLNCTRDPDNLNCQRLQFNLVVPKGKYTIISLFLAMQNLDLSLDFHFNFFFFYIIDADPVPLWFVRDNLSQGRALATDMHERAAKLQRPTEHTASRLHHLGNRASLIVRQLNKESQRLLLSTKVLRERLRTE